MTSRYDLCANTSITKYMLFSFVGILTHGFYAPILKLNLKLYALYSVGNQYFRYSSMCQEVIVTISGKSKTLSLSFSLYMCVCVCVNMCVGHLCQVSAHCFATFLCV